MTQIQTHQFSRDCAERRVLSCVTYCLRGVVPRANVKPRVATFLFICIPPFASGVAHVLNMNENGGFKSEGTVGDSEDVNIGKDRADSSLEDSLSSQHYSPSLKNSKLSLHELSFLAFPNQSQSNVYGLVNIRCDGGNILLVATLQGEVFWLEHSSDGLRTSFKPINFSYIPGILYCTRLIADSGSYMYVR